MAKKESQRKELLSSLLPSPPPSSSPSSSSRLSPIIHNVHVQGLDFNVGELWIIGVHELVRAMSGDGYIHQVGIVFQDKSGDVGAMQRRKTQRFE